MFSKSYSCIIVNRATGAINRFTLSLAGWCLILITLLALPLYLLVYAEWSASLAVARLQMQNTRLEVENSAYLVTANDLAVQLAGLDATMVGLTGRVDMDPSLLQAMSKLPDNIQIGTPKTVIERERALNALDRLRILLSSVGDRLSTLQRGVAYREALASATPASWPTKGRITATYGYRSDPFTGEQNFHPAIDISDQEGKPVYATATGQVFFAGPDGEYGNLVEIHHGFNLTTRYGHLSSFAIVEGDTVQSGDVIGYVGATGRATGYHVHYEILSNGRTIDPMKFLTQRDTITAN
jgi:murein DD-endopeptidase MepM/ murein hydrolase activator NlpD